MIPLSNPRQRSSCGALEPTRLRRLGLRAPVVSLPVVHVREDVMSEWSEARRGAALQPCAGGRSRRLGLVEVERGLGQVAAPGAELRGSGQALAEPAYRFVGAAGAQQELRQVEGGAVSLGVAAELGLVLLHRAADVALLLVDEPEVE